MGKQLGQNMCVRTFRAFPVGRRDTLKDFDTTDIANKNTMGTGVQNYPHSIAVSCEYGFADMLPERGDDSRIDGSDEDVHLQQPKAQVKQDSSFVLCSQCACVGTDLSQFTPAVHCTEVPWQAQRNAVVP